MRRFTERRAITHLEADRRIGTAVFISIRCEPQTAGGNIGLADLLIDHDRSPVAEACAVVFQETVSRQGRDQYSMQSVAGVGIGKSKVYCSEGMRQVLVRGDGLVCGSGRIVYICHIDGERLG